MHVGPYIVTVQTMCITFILSPFYCHVVPYSTILFSLHCAGPLICRASACQWPNIYLVVMCSPSVLKIRGGPNTQARVSTLSGTRLSSIKTSCLSKYVVIHTFLTGIVKHGVSVTDLLMWLKAHTGSYYIKKSCHVNIMLISFSILSNSTIFHVKM